MSEANRYLPEEWETRLEGIDLEIARQAIICKVPLLHPGVVERVLSNDAAVCGVKHDHAFETLRGLLFLHFGEVQHLNKAMGTEAGLEIAQRVRDHLMRRLDGRF